MFGLLGANGAGKSTTIECILGTKQSDAGTVRLLGQNPGKNRRELFERVGVQCQEGNYNKAGERDRLRSLFPDAGLFRYDPAA